MKEGLAWVVDVTAAVVGHITAITADGLEKEVGRGVKRNFKLESLRDVVRHMLGPLGASADQEQQVLEALVQRLQVRYTCVWELEGCVRFGYESSGLGDPRSTHTLPLSHTHV